MVFDNSKFKKLRNLLCLTQQAFAESVGSSQQVVAMVENNKRAVPASIKNGFFNAYGISYEKAIECDTREELNVLLNTQLIINYTNYTTSNNTVPLPYYFTKASAGSGITAPDYPEKDVIYFDKRWLQACIGRNINNLSLIKAEGDSMLPDINDGDLLMIDDSIKEVIPNKTFVIRQGNEYRVKKLKTELTGETLIISNNPKYPVEIVGNETEIIGQVVWNGSKENV